MTNLKALYERRKVFIDYKTPIPEELKKEISDAENEIFGNVKETLLGYLPEEIEMPTDTSIVFGLEYRDGKLVKTAMAINQGLEDKFDTVSNYTDEESEDNNEESNDSEPENRIKRRRVLYSLNGGQPMQKNRSVLEAVKLFLKEVPTATFEDIQYQFPSRLQGNYGVVRTLADIKKRSEYNRTEYRRWFLKPSDILTDANGVEFTVSTQWGNNFVNFQQHLKSNLSWTIKAVCKNQ